MIPTLIHYYEIESLGGDILFFPVKLICDGETTEIVNSRTNTIHGLLSGANAFFYQIIKKGSSVGLKETAMIDDISLKNRVCDVV